MRSLTLNRAVTQSRKTYQLVRCRSLAGSSEFQYEAMINNQWQVVTHNFVKVLWSMYYAKQRALVKVNSLSYIVLALAKSSVKLGGLDSEHEHYRSYCGFFVHNIQIHLFYGGLGEGAERLAGFVFDRSANLAQFTSSLLGGFGGEFYKLEHEGCLMTTIPNEIVSNKTISIDQIDIINKKLLQAEAILHLLSVNSRAEVQINDNLVCDVLWATSDLVADVRRFLHTDKSKEANL